MMSTVLDSMLSKYQPKTAQDYENALKEIIQEMTLAGLSRAGFFDKASFYGGTALRIFYGLPRFSEDLDFTLNSLQPGFTLKNYFTSMRQTLESLGLEVEIEEVKKDSDIDSAFIKTNTKILFLKIDAAKQYAGKIHSHQKMNIKFEVDPTPPLGFETEVKVLHPPITAAVKVLKLPYLFSGKIHAVLFRQWKNRVKGRDFYDLLWYLGRKTPMDLGYLENKMRQGGAWTEARKLTREDVLSRLESKINLVDFKSAGQDVVRFIKDPAEVHAWSQELFIAAIQDLKTQ